MNAERIRVALVLAIVLSITTALDVYAASLVLQPDSAEGKDSAISSGTLDGSFSNFKNLTTNIETDHGLIEFDLSEIHDDVIVTSATLEVLEEANCGFNINAIEVHLNGTAWDEATVTWDNAPAYGTSIGTNSGEESGPTCEWLIFDVTNAVQNWIAGHSRNFGFRLTGPDDAAVIKFTLSSDWEVAGDRPILRINYTDSVESTTSIPTMSVWSLGLFTLLIGLIGFFRIRRI